MSVIIFVAFVDEPGVGERKYDVGVAEVLGLTYAALSVDTV